MTPLRTWVMVLPPALLAALLALEEGVLAPHLGRTDAFFATLGLGVIGTLVFSLVVWRFVARAHRAVADALATRRHQAEQLDALSAATLALTAEVDLSEVLQRVVDLSRRIIGAQFGALAVLGADGDVERFLTSGLDPAVRERLGPPPTGGGLLGVVIRERCSLRLPDVTRDGRALGFPARHPVMRALLAVPIVYASRVVGSLYLTEGDSARTFDAADQDVLERFAAQAAVALANARMYEAARRVSALEERQRIAAELQDGVLQSLYGAGLVLQGSLDGLPTGSPEVRRQLETVVGRLDAVAADLRGCLTGLQAQDEHEASVVDRLRRWLDAEASGPDVSGALRARGRFDDLSRHLQWELWHIAREAVSEALQQQGVRHVDVHLIREDGRVRLAVQDDAPGRPSGSRPALDRPGMEEVRRRVREIGGSLVVLGSPGRGATVVADVPAPGLAD